MTPRHACRLVCLLILPVWLATFAPASSIAGRPAADEYDVKLAYLFNFALLTYWESTENANEFPLCVAGTNPFGARIDQLAGRLVQNLPIRIRYLGTETGADCRILFISASERQRMGRILQALASQPRHGVMTVSDLPGFAAEGGMVEFFQDGTHIRFAINAEQAQKAGLTLNAQLRQLASPAPGGKVR